VRVVCGASICLHQQQHAAGVRHQIRCLLSSFLLLPPYISLRALCHVARRGAARRVARRARPQRRVQSMRQRCAAMRARAGAKRGAARQGEVRSEPQQ